MSTVFVHSADAMGTVVSIQVVGGTDDAERRRRSEVAMAWFRELERELSRFDPGSELRRLTSHAGVPMRASPMLVSTLDFALALAEETDGAFDPTVGQRMVAAGFDRHHRTGARTAGEPVPDEGATWRDVSVDTVAGTVTLHRPLLLDLGAVAKGMAIDLAARELAPFEHFAIDAGGDLYFGGRNQSGAPWHVGVRHPRPELSNSPIIEALVVSDSALCTSGDYERIATPEGPPDHGASHHLLDPRTGQPAREAASVTVLAPTAMVGDALSTAAFVLGPDAGIELLERHGVEGLILTPSLERHTTAGWPGEPIGSHGRTGS